MSDGPKPGEVWDYPYLWAWQNQRSETEGRKDRPCAVAVALRRRDGRLGVFLLAITSQALDQSRGAIMVPDTEKRRAGLDQDKPLWVILDEYNSDVFEASYYLYSEAKLGAFSGAFLRQVQRAFRNVVATGKATGVGRGDD